MKTDRRPTEARRRREYDESSRLTEIQVPPSRIFVPLFRMLDAARDAEERVALDRASGELIEGLSAYYSVTPPHLKMLGVRPHSTSEGLLASELFGDYRFEDARIRLWTKTAMQHQWTSSRTLLSTLIHEFMHHLDVARLGFPSSFHTTGFFERTHRVYLSVLDQAYYPLAWRPPEKSGSRSIDWPATNRRRKTAP